MKTKGIFIGREKELHKLTENIFGVFADEGGGKSYSIIGPNGIGKTFLIRMLAERLREEQIPNVYCFWTSIEMPTEGSKVDAYWLFWIGLIRQFRRKIRMEALDLQNNIMQAEAREIQEIYDFFNSDDEMNKINEAGTNARAIDYLNAIFQCYAQIGIRIILVIDEFDRAKETFVNGAFFQRLFDLSPKARGPFDDELDLSILLISRRSVGTIAHGMKKGSNLEDAYFPITIRGFNDAEMQDYYSLYGDWINDDIKESIEYFCGRSPALLMGVYEKVREQEKDLDVPSMLKIIRESIRVPYDHMCKIMQTEFVDHDKTQNCMGKFIQTFIGPAYDENLEVYMEKLYSYGYVTMNDDKEGYTSIAKKFDQEWNLKYDPIAPYFVEYVRRTVLPEDMTGLEKNMWYIEDEVRKILRQILQNKYGEDWKQHIDDYVGEGKKDFYLLPLQRMAETMAAEERGFVYSKLDVLNFVEYGKIIKAEWCGAKTYFSSYKTKQELSEDFYILREVRNSYAHRTQGVFDRKYIENARKICERIIKDFAMIGEEKCDL